MKITRAQVRTWAEERGLGPIQIDGIPEGFSFKEPDINIGGVEHAGKYVAYIPLSDWVSVYADDTQDLLTRYNEKHA